MRAPEAETALYEVVRSMRAPTVRPSFQTSTGKLMLVVIVAAFELALFQDVWLILVMPPFTIVTLTLNFGLWFLLVRPRWMETRIIGLQLGGVMAALGCFLYMWLGFRGFYYRVSEGRSQSGPCSEPSPPRGGSPFRPAVDSGDAPPARSRTTRSLSNTLCSTLCGLA